jgi:hypothetical protein
VSWVTLLVVMDALWLRSYLSSSFGLAMKMNRAQLYVPTLASCVTTASG